MLDGKKMQLIYDIKIELGFSFQHKISLDKAQLLAVAVFLLKAVVVDAAAADNYDQLRIEFLSKCSKIQKSKEIIEMDRDLKRRNY